MVDPWIFDADKYHLTGQRIDPVDLKEGSLHLDDVAGFEVLPFGYEMSLWFGFGSGVELQSVPPGFLLENWSRSLQVMK